jgi:hypothetical protein
MEKILQWLILAFGDHLPRVSKYISVQSKTHAKEESILNASLDIKEECATSAIVMLLVGKFMEKVELIHVKYALISESNSYRLLVLLQ